MSFSNEPAFDEPKTNIIENTLGTSLRYKVSKIFPVLSILYILERGALQNLHTLLTVFRNNGIMLQKY